MNYLLDKVQIILMENNVSVETMECVIKLLIADKFKKLDDINSKYASTLWEIKTILDNGKIDDFECVEKIISIFENLDISLEYRHDFS